MKVQVLGLKRFSGKDGRNWVNVAYCYKDISAEGGMFADKILLQSNQFPPEVSPGDSCNFEFDQSGRVIDITPVKG